MKVSRAVAMTSAALLGGAMVCLGVAPVAGAAPDRTPPKLNLPAYASFVKGTTIGPMALDPDYGVVATSGIQMKATWSASDASGICGYRTRDEGGAWRDDWSAWGNQRSETYGVSDYDDQQGGGGEKFEFTDVQVRDCAGNITEKSVAVFPKVFQENGESYGYGTLGTAYTGSWGTSTCACWSGGFTRKTTGAGAGVAFTFTGLWMTGSHPVAVVMERAPNRGKAKVLIDGVYRATFDTYASTATHRSVVWVGNMPMGAHTLTIVNLATAGRPRIDVDAVLVSSSVTDH